MIGFDEEGKQIVKPRGNVFWSSVRDLPEMGVLDGIKMKT